MKFISAILGVYILALAVLPCADEAGWCVFDVEDTFGIELHESGNHDHENECSDHCSPLCTCNCCHITVRAPVKSDFAISAPEFILSGTPLLESSLIDLTSVTDIWQPPKLS